MKSNNEQFDENLKDKAKWSLLIIVGLVLLSLIITNLIPYVLGVVTGMVVSNPKEIKTAVIKLKNRLKTYF